MRRSFRLKQALGVLLLLSCIASFSDFFVLPEWGFTNKQTKDSKGLVDPIAILQEYFRQNETLSLRKDKAVPLPFPRWDYWNRSLVKTNLSMDTVARHTLSGNANLDEERIDLVHAIDKQYRIFTIHRKGRHPHNTLSEDRHLGRARQMILYLWRPALYLMRKARSLNTRNHYPALDGFFENNSQGLILLFGRYADGVFCRSDLPILSVDSPLDNSCLVGFPMPNFELVKLMLRRERYAVSQPNNFEDWYTLEPRAIWRGSPTGPTSLATNPRVALCRKALEYPDLIDAQLVLKKHQSHIKEDPEYSDLIADKPSSFDRYRAVIDLDGNAWSSRFASLLCSQQVVLKVQPRSVDYFFPSLEPYVHYIPVNANLSDLKEQALRAVFDDELALRIISNANAWCHVNLTRAALVAETARLIDAYAAATTLAPSMQDSTQSLLAEYDVETHTLWNWADIRFRLGVAWKLRFVWPAAS